MITPGSLQRHAGRADIAVMLATLLQRLTPAAPPAAPSRLFSRIEVCPPAARRAWWARAGAWLRGDLAAAATAADARLDAVRAEFAEAIGDCIDDAVSVVPGDVLMRVNTAQSLRDLWHLRPALYHVIALRHSQFEAEQRLVRLNRHFPTRAPRSGFAPLDA
jgi:predicted NBD/HSP70 family sugar kinase